MLLDCVLQKLFTAKAFEHEHVLISKFDGDAHLTMPDVIGKDQLIHWVESLKTQQVSSILFYVYILANIYIYIYIIFTLYSYRRG